MVPSKDHKRHTEKYHRGEGLFKQYWEKTSCVVIEGYWHKQGWGEVYCGHVVEHQTPIKGSRVQISHVQSCFLNHLLMGESFQY